MMKMTERCERYEEMFLLVQQFIELGFQFETYDERNLFSVCCSNQIGSLRCSWRIINSIASKNNERKKIVEEYKQKIERETLEFIDNLTDLLEIKIIPNTKKENRVFFMKMK